MKLTSIKKCTYMHQMYYMKDRLSWIGNLEKEEEEFLCTF